MSSTQTTSSKKVDFLSDYDIKGIIGKGTFSIVKLGENKKTKEKVAIKIMQKNKILSKDDLIRIEREIEILKRLSHPNVIKIHKIFEDEKRYYIIMEFCENGELFNRIVEKRYLTEDEASLFYYQLINGLEYIHKNNIVHRDLKPENLLLAKNDLLKIIDFGLSNYTENDLLLGTPCGSPCYASPEMVSGQRYNGYMIDVWSTGIILFAMVCGYLPFEDNNNEILFEKILKCRINYPGSMGKLTLDLMKKIITPDPKKRITLEQIKQHPFYLKGKGLFKKKFPKIISEVKNDEDNNKPIKEIIINNVTPIVKTNILKNIKENKGKINIDNNMCYPLNINEINNLYKSYQTEITKVNNLPSNINNTQDLNNINALKPYPNIKSEEKENIIKKDHKLESPSSLKSDEIPQDSVPVELSEVKNKIKNIPVKLDVKKNLKEEMNIISNSIHSKNIKINKIYKTNPKIPKEKEKDILYLSTKNRTIEKDRKKINNINYMTAKSQLNDRIVVDFYQKDKLISTLDNINNPSRAQKMDYYNMNEIQSKNKNTKVAYKFDKNSVLNNKPNNQINDDKNKVLIKEVSDEYLTNNKPNQNNNKLIKITNTFSKRIQRKPIYGINKLTNRNNFENNMNLSNVNPEISKYTSKLNSYTYDEKIDNDIFTENNKNNNFKNIFNEFQLINNNTNSINIDSDRNKLLNIHNNKTNITERNKEIPLITGKTTAQIPNKDFLANKKEMYRLNNYVNNKDNINLNSDRNYHHAVRSKNLSMTRSSKNRKIINPITNISNNDNIYSSNNNTNFRGLSPINDKYFDTITINNNNSINLHEPKLYIYFQNNNNTSNIANYQRLKTESNPNKKKIIFKCENKINANAKNTNKINSVEYNKIVPAKRINTNINEYKTLDNDINLKQRYKATPIKNNNTMVNSKDIKKNDKFIITKKMYNSIVPNNKKIYTFQTSDIVFNNSKKSKDNNIKYITSKNNNNFYLEKNLYNEPITKSINNNTIVQISNISKSLDKSNYPYQNIHNIVNTEGNIDLLGYDNKSYLNNNNIILNNYINNNNQRILRKDDFNFSNNKNNFDNNDYKMKIQKLQLKNYAVNNKENKNFKYAPQTMNDLNVLDSFKNYRRINTITSNSMRTPDTKQNYKNMISFKHYVKNY